MSILNKLFQRKKSSELQMSIADASRFFEKVGVSIYTKNDDNSLVKIAGGEAPTANAKEAYNKATSWMQKGQYSKAIPLYKAAIALSPNFTDAHYNLAVILFSLDDIEGAKNEYEIVLTLQPYDIDALNNLGVIHIKQGNFEKAKELFEKALSINKEVALTHRNLAAYYEKIGDMEQCQDHKLNSFLLDKDALKFSVVDPYLK